MGRLPHMALAVAVGAMTVAQSRVNGAIGERAGSGLVVALLTFTIGTAVTGAAVCLVPRWRAATVGVLRAVRRGQPRLGMTVRGWHLIGGCGGALFVTSQGLSVPAIGVAVFTVAVVTGQNLSSLLVDRLGWGPGGRQPITLLRTLAALLAVVGVLISVAGDLSAPAFAWGALALALGAGAATAAQQAINARVATAAGTPWVAGLGNFVVGFAAVLVVAVVFLADDPIGDPSQWGQWWRWWMVAGGLLGVFFIVSAALVVPHLGVLLFALLATAGQVGAALALTAALPRKGESVTWWLVLGVLITGGSAAVATLTRAGSAGRRRP